MLNKDVYNDDDDATYMYRLQYWALCLLVFPALTLFGNMLVCLSVYVERSLHTVTNYFIVSLAVADIMVAILVMPLAVYVEVLAVFISQSSVTPHPVQSTIQPRPRPRNCQTFDS